MEPLFQSPPSMIAAGAVTNILAPGSILYTRDNLMIRLAADTADIKAAQRLRHQIFSAGNPQGSDHDAFDNYCDHIVVIDRAGDENSDAPRIDDGQVIATYRLLPQGLDCGFYTQQEFNIAALANRHTDLRFLELGRSCVLPAYRSRMIIDALWQAVWNYVRIHRFDVLFGCASFAGTDPEAIAEPLSFLARETTAPTLWQAYAHPHRAVAMERLAGCEINRKRAIAGLPPLIKGYLRLGAKTGTGAVIDERFGCIDVLIILPVSEIKTRFFKHFGAPDATPSAS